MGGCYGNLGKIKAKCRFGKDYIEDTCRQAYKQLRDTGQHTKRWSTFEDKP